MLGGVRKGGIGRRNILEKLYRAAHADRQVEPTYQVVGSEENDDAIQG